MVPVAFSVFDSLGVRGARLLGRPGERGALTAAHGEHASPGDENGAPEAADPIGDEPPGAG